MGPSLSRFFNLQVAMNSNYAHKSPWFSKTAPATPTLLKICYLDTKWKQQYLKWLGYNLIFIKSWYKNTYQFSLSQFHCLSNFVFFFTSVIRFNSQACFEPLPSFGFLDLCECYGIFWLYMRLHLMFK